MNRRVAVRFWALYKVQLVLLVLIGIIAVLLWFWLETMKEEGQYPVYLVALLWILVLIASLWTGNLLIYDLIQRKYSWESAFNRRFYLQLFWTLLYTLGCINFTYILFKNHYTALPPDQNQMILLNIYGLLFILPVLSIQFGLLFLRKWKQSIVEKEHIKKEQVQSELLTLKSHLSPHFLFNNLNILSSLIDAENEEAQDYLDRFTMVYRYVLRNRENELISLAEELKFIQSYEFLLRRRFPSSLLVETRIPSRYHHWMLPPLSMQMVLENALKHNKLSESNPLSIKISATNTDEIVIQNTLQTRAVPSYEKTGFGLENIRRRYWLIAKKDIGISKGDDLFTVRLPLIEKASTHEHIDH